MKLWAMLTVQWVVDAHGARRRVGAAEADVAAGVDGERRRVASMRAAMSTASPLALPPRSSRTPAGSRTVPAAGSSSMLPPRAVRGARRRRGARARRRSPRARSAGASPHA